MEIVSQSDANVEFERLVLAHSTGLLKLCYLFLGDRMLAEDAVQETFLKAYAAYAKFRGESSEGTWLTRIAINVCKNLLRSPWRRHIAQSITPEDLPETGYSDAHEDTSLICEIVKLPFRQKEVLLLFYYRDFSLSEIANLLNIGENTAAARLSRARKRLKAQLKGWGQNEK